MICIICRKDKENMSDEHVIPDSMRGYYHIYSVCKDCNSDLGDRVDSPLVNHKLTELYRFSKDISGKKGKIPNPFSGLYFHENNEDIKFRLEIDKENKLNVKTLPAVKVQKDGDEIKSIEVTLDTNDEHKIDELLNKVAKRHNIPREVISAGDKSKVISNDSIKGKWVVDTLKFKIGLLKIAYEFAVDTLGDYFDDVDAIKISKILESANYDLVEKYVKVGNGLQPEVFKPYENYLDLDSEKHYLVLSRSQFGLMCLVKLHDLFAVGVILSSKNYLEPFETIIGINDINAKTFKKYSLEEVLNSCHGPAHTRIAYHFDTEQETFMAQIELSKPDFKYYGIESGEIPLFDKTGKKYPFLLHELLSSLKAKTEHQGNWRVETFYFNEHPRCFVKSQATGNLYQIGAFELSRERVNRI